MPLPHVLRCVAGARLRCAVRSTITTGNNPYNITVDKARKTIYTANVSPNDDPNRPVSASAIDAATFAQSTITGVGKQPSAVAVDTANGAVYVSDSDGGKVYVIKPCYTCPALPTPSK